MIISNCQYYDLLLALILLMVGERGGGKGQVPFLGSALAQCKPSGHNG